MLLFYSGQRKKQYVQDVLEYLKRVDDRAEEREKRMVQHMQQTTTSLLGLVERMVFAIEGFGNHAQNN